jgi:hypothetical protein
MNLVDPIRQKVTVNPAHPKVISGNEHTIIVAQTGCDARV